MAKKLSLVLAAAAVLAFAVPAFASAATGLTEGGKLVETGKIITGTNVGAVKTTSPKLGTIECQSVMVEAKLSVNTAAEVKAVEGGTQTATTCTRAGATVKVFGIQLKELKTNGGGTGTATAAFKVELTPGGVVCEFSGTNDTGTYNPTETAEGGNVLTISEGALSVTPAACGSSAKLDGVFKISTQNSTTPVYLM